MFSRAPAQLPCLEVLLNALPRRTNKEWGKFLGVSERTFARWRADNMAPRPYALALYWESDYGVQHLHADAFNMARQAAAEAAGLRRELARLAGVVERLETDHDWGSANAPIYSTN